MRWKTYNTKQLKEKYLFKFIPFGRLKDFIETGKIWFSRADQFGDKMECVKILDLKSTPVDYPQINERKRRTLISCWHLADKESVAMWDTYAHKKENRKNIALRFLRPELISSIDDNLRENGEVGIAAYLVHGKVRYKNLINSKSNELSKSKIKYAAFRKESAFSYEREYRFTIRVSEEFESVGFGYKIGNPDKMKFDILINPLLDNASFSLLEEKANNLG